jgi:hypothetical protein
MKLATCKNATVIKVRILVSFFGGCLLFSLDHYSSATMVSSCSVFLSLLSKCRFIILNIDYVVTWAMVSWVKFLYRRGDFIAMIMTLN